MSNRTRLSLGLLFCSSTCWSPAWAANVSGFGSLETNRSDPGFSIDSEYEDSQLINARNSVTLSPVQIGVTNGTKLLSHLGQAQFGRLRARALTLGSIFQETDLSTSVSIGMEFEDLFTPQDLNPATVRALRFDVELHGEMIKISNTVGEGAFATFVLGLREANGAAIPCLGFTVEFTWSGDARSVASEAGCEGNPDTPSFVPDPGQEPRFELSPIVGTPRYLFATRGHLEIPTDDFEGFEGLALGAPFLLRVHARAQASCSSEPCGAQSDIVGAVIDNARFVDANGDPVVGATFTTESGTDYITAVPEPEGSAAALAVLGAICASASRRASRFYNFSVNR